jgi:Cd2+/Zn2+-exporting ATPase
VNNTKKNHGCSCGHSHGSDSGKLKTVRLIIGGSGFGMALLIKTLLPENHAVNLFAFLAAYLVLGADVLRGALKNILRGKVFDENFLMSIASAGAFAIGDFPEAAAVMLFYQVGEMFQDMAVSKSRKSIAGLMDIRPDFANLINADGSPERVEPQSVNPGDLILVRPGEKIPLDGTVVSGESSADTSALTGEPVPRRLYEGQEVLSGFVNQTGLLTIRVTKSFGQSTVSKILTLVESAAEKKAPTENFVTKFSRFYTPTVVCAAVGIALFPPLFGLGTWAESIRRALVFLVISCPCALVLSIPLGFFGGIGGASRHGVLVKGGNFLEALGKLDTVVFDKTGTLTKGVFRVTECLPENGWTQSRLLAVAARAEAYSNHPIALSIIKAFGGEVNKSLLDEYTQTPGEGVSARFDGARILAGSPRLLARHGIAVTDSELPGTKVYVAQDGVFVGLIVISDEIKPDSAAAVKALKARGIRKTVMLTGDNPQTAKEVAEKLGLDEVCAGLLPDGKVEALERLESEIRKNGKLAFVGDGVNDAPVLARADVGVAMGSLGSDAAVEAADVVLMTDEPGKLAQAVDIARFTRRVVWQNIAFALGIKAAFLVLGLFGIANMWEAVFADVGVALLAVLNATRVIKN